MDVSLNARARLVAFALCFCPIVMVAQTGSESTLATFSAADGIEPQSLIQASDGNFYGVATFGGSSLGTGACVYTANNTDLGCGTVYQMTPSGQVNVLHNFEGTDGGAPDSLIEGSDGNFYGTTAFGSLNSGVCLSVGCGTIFEITPLGDFSLLYSFTGGNDGAFPVSLVLGSDGTFYGTAGAGGSSGWGVFFQISASWMPTPLYNFSGGTDGYWPGALLQASDENFYGMTQAGGSSTSACRGDFFSSGCGTVFGLTSAGDLAMLYPFEGVSDGGNYAPSHRPAIVVPRHGHIVEGIPGGYQNILPNALVEGEDGNLYGATQGYKPPPGASGPIPLTIFKITLGGNLTTLYTFPDLSEDNSGSGFGLTAGTDGNLYGVGNDFIFQVSSTRVFNNIYTFSGDATGGLPGVLSLGSNGAFYGGALTGGGTTGVDSTCPNGGCGTLFEVSLSPALKPPVTLSFASSSTDPGTPVILTWKVSNAFSTTLQQCYAFVQGGSSDAGLWTRQQTGTLMNGVYGGSISITPTQAGSYTYALTCGGVETGFATLTVIPPSLTTTSLPTAYVGVPYSATLSATGGETPYAWAQASGHLPEGLSMDASTGTISGTSTSAATSNFTVTVTDAETEPLMATADLSITSVVGSVSATPSILNVSAPGGSASTTLTVTGFASNAINLSCSGLPSEASCSFGTPAAGNGMETVALSINTSAFSVAIVDSPNSKRGAALGWAAVFPGLLVLMRRFGKRRRNGIRRLAAFSLLALLLPFGSGCGNTVSLAHPNPGTPTGQSLVTVTATGSGQTATFLLTLNVE